MKLMCHLMREIKQTMSIKSFKFGQLIENHSINCAVLLIVNYHDVQFTSLTTLITTDTVMGR